MLETVKKWVNNNTVTPIGLNIAILVHNGEPARHFTNIVRCPKCGREYCTDNNYICCSCGNCADVIYAEDLSILNLQDAINHLNVRINYMLATKAENVLPFIAEMRELSDWLAYGLPDDLETQVWKQSDIHSSITYSLR